MVEVAISAGPDGEFGTDDDEVEVRARGSSDDASTEEAPEAEAEPEAEEAPAEETATWDDGEDPGTERDHANGTGSPRVPRRWWSHQLSQAASCC